MKKSQNGVEILSPNYRHSQVFSADQEDMLAQYVTKCAKMFHGITPNSLRKLAYDLAVANKFKYPSTWDKNGMAGKEWQMAFMRRHPELSIRQPEATSLARATAFNRHNINAFFNLLQEAYCELNVTGSQILNLDETGITTVHKVPKVIASKGVKQLGQITSGERGELVTMCCVISADGQSIPPVFVFPRKNKKDHMMYGAPEGSLGLVSSSGWMTADNFVKVMDHIIKHKRPSATYPLILTMDNHESHLKYAAIELAKQNHVHIITLPPHTSNKTQPLDRCVFGPLKASYSQLANAWMLQNAGKTISIYQIAALGGSAFLKAATPANILSGFRVSGVWPLNPQAFGTDEYLPSDVTDRPLPTPELSTPPPLSTSAALSSAAPATTPAPSTSAVLTSAPSMSAASTTSAPSTSAVTTSAPSTSAVSTPAPSTSSVSIPVSAPSMSAATTISTPSTSAVSTSATPSTSAKTTTPSSTTATQKITENCFHVSPVDLRGYPKAPPRKESNRGRKRGRCMRATSTPEMKRMTTEAARKATRKDATKSRVTKKLTFDDDSDPDMDLSLSDFEESESDDETLQSSEKPLSLSVVETVSVDDFVVCEFATKRATKYFVGQVTKERDSDDDVEIDFYRRKGKSFHFVKPAVADVSSVHIDAIKAILPPPIRRGTTMRTKGEVTFEIDFSSVTVELC